MANCYVHYIQYTYLKRCFFNIGISLIQKTSRTITELCVDTFLMSTNDVDAGRHTIVINLSVGVKVGIFEL